MTSTKLGSIQKRTIKALLIALAQLETSLPEDLQDDIHQIGKDLENQLPVNINRISQLVTKHPQLNDFYHTALSNLEREYQINDKKDQPKLKVSLSASGTIAIEPIAIEMLTADDFQTTAQEIVKQVKNSKDSFFKTFQTKVSVAQAKADLKAFSVLKALEFRPLSIEDLASTLKMSTEEVRKIIQRLWDEGKINTIKAGILGTIFPFLRPQKRPSQINDANTYFTLTSFGYFDLHPVIKVS